MNHPDWMREPPEPYDSTLWDEAHEDEAEKYVREHVHQMHDDFDVAPYVIRIMDVWDDSETSWDEKRHLLASIATEIRDAHIAVALDDIRRRYDAA